MKVTEKLVVTTSKPSIAETFNLVDALGGSGVNSGPLGLGGVLGIPLSLMGDGVGKSVSVDAVASVTVAVGVGVATGETLVFAEVGTTVVTFSVDVVLSIVGEMEIIAD